MSIMRHFLLATAAKSLTCTIKFYLNPSMFHDGPWVGAKPKIPLRRLPFRLSYSPLPQHDSPELRRDVLNQRTFHDAP